MKAGRQRFRGLRLALLLLPACLFALGPLGAGGTTALACTAPCGGGTYQVVQTYGSQGINGPSVGGYCVSSAYPPPASPPSPSTGAYGSSYTLYSDLSAADSGYATALADWQLWESEYLSGTHKNPGAEPVQPPPLSDITTVECPPEPPGCPGGTLPLAENVYPSFSITSGPTSPMTATFIDPFNGARSETTGALSSSLTEPDAYARLNAEIYYYPWTGIDASGSSLESWLINYADWSAFESTQAFPSSIPNPPKVSPMNDNCTGYDQQGTSRCLPPQLHLPPGSECIFIPKTGFYKVPPSPLPCLASQGAIASTLPCGVSLTLTINPNVNKGYSSGSLATAPCDAANIDCPAGVNLPAYVGVPTCAWIQGSSLPSPGPPISSPTVTRIVAGPFGKVEAWFYTTTSFSPGPITINWETGATPGSTPPLTSPAPLSALLPGTGPGGDIGTDPFTTGSLPALQSDGTWTTGDCSAWYRYPLVTPGTSSYRITATEDFFVTAKTVWEFSPGSTGTYYYPAAAAGITCLNGVKVFDNCEEQVKWGPVTKQVMQIESVPFLP